MTCAALVEDLAGATIGATFNFYRDGAGAGLRRDRLRRYLEDREDALLLLVAEAAGYRGSRVSGVPLTSERQLSGRGPAEATATIVHRVLTELGIEEETLLWNVVPTHPHLPGRPDTNRRPTRGEVEASRRYLDLLVPRRRVVPVGRLAHALLGGTYVRHPSHGGADGFRAGVRRIVAPRQRRGG
ncbi:MAG: uracil-DNA glycosylase [Actinomycetota bacterium]|nr:uracil-DNA glycosylase [Actinomycetota bacterium]